MIVYVCFCVCVCVYVRACVYLCAGMCLCVQVSVCAYLRMCQCVRACHIVTYGEHLHAKSPPTELKLAKALNSGSPAKLSATAATSARTPGSTRARRGSPAVTATPCSCVSLAAEYSCRSRYEDTCQHGLVILTLK